MFSCFIGQHSTTVGWNMIFLFLVTWSILLWGQLRKGGEEMAKSLMIPHIHCSSLSLLFQFPPYLASASWLDEMRQGNRSSSQKGSFQGFRKVKFRLNCPGSLLAGRAGDGGLSLHSPSRHLGLTMEWWQISQMDSHLPYAPFSQLCGK